MSTISLQPQRGVIDKGNKPTYKHVELISVSHVKRVIDITETEGNAIRFMFLISLSDAKCFLYETRLPKCICVDMPEPLRNKRALVLVRNNLRGCRKGGFLEDPLSVNGEYHLQS